MAYSAGDAVFRIDTEGNIDRGLVINKVSYGASDDSDEGGYYNVAWHPSGRQDVVSGNTLQLCDRFLMPGFVVRKVVSGKGTQLGYCRRTEVFSTVQIVGSNSVICHVNSVDLVPLEKFARDAAICVDSRLGSIRDLNTELTLLFPEGSLCVLLARDAVGMEDLQSERQLPCPFQPGCFYKGQRLCGSMMNFKSGRWHYCARKTRAYPMELHVQVTVDDVKMVNVAMESVCKDYQETFVDRLEAGKEKMESQEKLNWRNRWKKSKKEEEDIKLKGDVDRSTMERVKALDKFRPSKARLGDRNYYKLKDTDDIISLAEWKRQFASEYCPLQGPVDVNAVNGQNGPDPSEQPPWMKPGHVVLTETLATHTVAEVVWQDGTIEQGISSSELHIAHRFDSHESYDFLPGNFVIRNTGTITDEPPPLEYGVVNRVNPSARTAFVTFFKISQTDPKSEELGAQEISTYDIREHPDFTFRLGYCVLRVSNFQATESGIGQVADILPEGRVVVEWASGEVSACYPQELFHVTKYDTNDDAYDVPPEIPPFYGPVVENPPAVQPNPAVAAPAAQNWFQNPFLNQAVAANPAVAPLAAQNWFQNAFPMNQAVANAQNPGEVQNQGAVQNQVNVGNPGALQDWEQVAVLNNQLGAQPIAAVNGVAGDFQGFGFPVNAAGAFLEQQFFWLEQQPFWWDQVRIRRLIQEMHNKYLELEETYTHLSTSRSASDIRKLLEFYKNSGEMHYRVWAQYYQCRCLLVLARVVWRHGRTGLPPRLFGRLVRFLEGTLSVAQGPKVEEDEEPPNRLPGKVAGSLEMRPVCRELSRFLRIVIMDIHEKLQADLGAEPTAVNVPIDDQQAGSEVDQKALGVISIAEALPSSHHYRLTTPAFGNHYPAFVAAVEKDVALIRSSSLKSIRIKTFPNRMDLYSVLIQGCQSTPYEDSLFVFDVRLPRDYPQSPPQCHYVSYCSDNLHPSLCWSGRVDIHLLIPPEEGGSWLPDVSSLLDVLLSLQGLVSASEPYFDKPNSDRQDEQECAKSRLYNELVVLRLVQSMGHMFRNPHSVFKEEIEKHFKDNEFRLGRRLERWLELSDAWDARFPEQLPTPEALKEFAEKGAHSSNQANVFPEFPLLPASRGFRMALRKALKSFKETF